MLVSISASLSGSVAVTGVVNTLVMKNVVHALFSLRPTSRRAERTCIPFPGRRKQGTLQRDVEVDADDESLIINIAGSLSASGSVGVGADYRRAGIPQKRNGGRQRALHVSAVGSVRVTANAKDDLFLLAIAFGAPEQPALRAAQSAGIP